MTRQQKFLLVISPILVISMTLWAYFSTSFWGITVGYISTNLIYWIVFCIPSVIFITKGKKQAFVKMYMHKDSTSKTTLFTYNLLSFIPACATGFIVFMPTINVASAIPIIIALIYAILNGSIEELFWRGLFNKAFNNNIIFAFIYPTIMFSGWHVALASANGVIYTGGSITLLVGASFMGMLWGFVAYKTKSIKYITIAHIITNFFAFSGLIYTNWFM